MIKPPVPVNERQRLKALRDLKILDTPTEERFDRVTRLARRVFGTSIALVSLVDEGRQWFKSRVGLDASETPRDVSFCGHAILDDRVMVVPDARLDERFHDNPLVTCDPNIRFYAGYPLSAPDGSKVGTLCVIDQKPRKMDAEDMHLLRELGRMIEEDLVAVDTATTDAVCQISNRRGFNELADHALRMCDRLGSPATLLTFELDIENIMADAGDEAAKRALLEFSQLLMVTFRSSDVVARTGPADFAVLLVGADGDNYENALHRLRESLSQANLDDEANYQLEKSHKVAVYDPKQHADSEELLRYAESLSPDQPRVVASA